VVSTIGILIGGASRRMGLPKALMPVDGTTLIERTSSVAAGLGGEIVLLGTAPFTLPAAIRALPVVEDLHPGIGPMAGLEAMLRSRPNGPCMLLACDMPYLTAALLRRLAEARSDRDGAVCCTGGVSPRRHPCCGVYNPSILPAVEAAVSAGRYGLTRLLKGLRVHEVALTDAEARWVENWNEPDDVTAAEQKAGRD
jgi:molybdopterin-guanine dinucleotide biosynthesis protein A